MKRKAKIIINKNKVLKIIFKVFTDIRDYNIIKKNRNYEKVISNIIGGKVMVRIRNIPGEYFIDARSHILKRILLSKEYEPKIVELILKSINPNKDIINVGANIGLFTNLSAFKLNEGRKVLAIEPTLNAFNSLNENILLNKNKNRVIVFKGVATDKKGNYKINVIQGMEEYSSIGQLVHASIINKENVSEAVLGETVDNLIKQHNIAPGLIIIDAEGAELNVLKGAIETLKKYHPVIISELDDKLLTAQNSNSKQVINFLEEQSYIVKNIEGAYPDFPFCGNIIASI